MPQQDYLKNSRIFSDKLGRNGEIVRQWTEWEDAAEILCMDTLDVTNLKRSPLFIWRSGISQCDREFVRHRPASAHCRMFGIEIVTAGNAEVVQNGKLFTIGPGKVYLLHNYAELTFRTGPAGFLNKRYICIDGPVLDAMIRIVYYRDLLRDFPRRGKNVHGTRRTSRTY